MKLLFKQRLFSWLDSYDIYDEEGNTIFVVKGEFSWGHCLQIYTPDGGHIGTLKEEILTFLPKFKIFINEQYVGEIVKEFSFLHPKFSLDCNGWTVEGSLFEWDYTVLDAIGEAVAVVEKDVMHLTDTYIIDVPKQEHVLYALMIVLAIDAAKCSSK